MWGRPAPEATVGPTPCGSLGAAWIGFFNAKKRGSGASEASGFVWNMYEPIFCSSTDRHVSYLRAELPSQGEEGRKGSSMGKRQVIHKALIM